MLYFTLLWKQISTMNPDSKKISFGFSKLIKKQNISSNPTKTEKTVELIECLEGSEIKVKNSIEAVEKGPLVIAIKGNANNLVGRIERESLKNKKKEIKEEEDTRKDSELTVDELAARQLLREARNRLTQEKDTTKVHVLPLTDEKIVVEDGQEPTIDDYDSVPINDYGLAMLRGMGWKEGMSIGRNQSKSIKPIEPELRPKGLGLGAQKIIDSDPKDVFDKNGKKLNLVKGAFAKIIAGSHKGTYCEVQGLDEESGRIIVKTCKTNVNLTLNELFVIPVTKEDYSLGSKIINNVKYERYKQDIVNERKSPIRYKHEEDEYGKSNTSQVAIKNEEHDHSSFKKHGNKNEKEDTTDENSSERKKKYVENSSDEYNQSRDRLKIKEKKQGRSRSKSDKKTHSSKIHSYEKEKKSSSDDYRSEDECYSRRKNFKYREARDYSSDSSSSSDKGKERNKKKKSKKSRRERNNAYSEYRSRKSQKESKKKESKTKSEKQPKRGSISGYIDTFDQY